jgi:hypothetical protein
MTRHGNRQDVNPAFYCHVWTDTQGKDAVVIDAPIHLDEKPVTGVNKGIHGQDNLRSAH